MTCEPEPANLSLLQSGGEGREAARELFTRQLEKQTWLTDLEERRQAFGAKK